MKHAKKALAVKTLPDCARTHKPVDSSASNDDLLARVDEFWQEHVGAFNYDLNQGAELQEREVLKLIGILKFMQIDLVLVIAELERRLAR
jgi:hypothetical protein